MHVSLSEIETVVCKAAWAVGLDLGLGEEAGRTARRMAVQGPVPLSAYADALEGIDAGTSEGFDPARAAAGHFAARGPERSLSALRAAPAVRDLLLSGAAAQSDKVTLSRVDLPILVVAELLAASETNDGAFDFVANADLAGGCARGELHFTTGDSGRLGALAPGDLTITRTAREADRGEAVEENAGTAHGTEVEAAVWRRLTRLADRRLVEASEASRLQGAGAGLVDRD